METTDDPNHYHPNHIPDRPRGPDIDIPLIVLAAGASTRMGTAKQLLRYNNSTLLRLAATTALASRCRPVIVVLGSSAAESQKELAGLGVRVCINTSWETGMGSSLKAGLRVAIESEACDAVAVMVCDQPGVTAAHLDRLVAEFLRSPERIVASDYNGITGVPAVFGAKWFDSIVKMDDSAGARQIIQKHPKLVTPVPCPEGAIDVDTPADYETLKSSVTQR